MAAVAAIATPSGSRTPSHRSMVGKQSQAEPLAASLLPDADHTFFSCPQSQLCLALSILKSKPDNVNTRGEYCLKLRQHVKQGKPAADGEHRYIDSTEFWKDQYSKIHSEKKTMEVRLAQLEMLSDQSRMDSRAPTPELYSLDTAIDRQPEISPSDAQSTNNLPLLKQASILHRFLRDQEVSTNILESAIQSSLSYMNSAITEACEIKSKVLDGPGDRVNHVSLRTLGTVAAIFSICMKGLAHLCRDIPGRRCKGQVIFSLVQFFVNALGHLHNMCLRRTVYQAPNIGNHQGKACPKADCEETSRTLTLISGLTHFLVNILRCPDFQEAHLSHIEVLEGMFSALLGEVGGLISLVIFGEHLSTLRGPATSSRSNRNTPASTNALAVDLKCRHLAYILKQTIEGRSENDKYSLAAMLAGMKVLGIGAGKKVVLARARQRLQETLLKGIFGDDGEEFMNALQMPESGEGWDKDAPQLTQNEKEAFMESVWSSVGWNLMLND